MSDQFEFHPVGLTRSQFDRLSEYADRAETISPGQLLEEARQHLEQTQQAHAANRMINVRLAAAIVVVIERVANMWDSLSANHRTWLAAAMLYFSSCDDDEPDFDSPIGFEDDVEVLNSSLRLAGLNGLCLNSEDYDDA
ncbi:MAG: hypothetical protein ABGZ35_15650 [Planctomycetaceae bacterium]